VRSPSAIYALLCLLSPPLFALEPLILDDARSEYILKPHLDYLEDNYGEWTIAQVSSPTFKDRFVASPDQIPGFGKTDAAIWVRFLLRDEADQPRRWLVHTHRSRTHVRRKIADFGWFTASGSGTEYGRTELYIPQADTFVVKRAPVDRTFAARDLKYRCFAFAIPPAVRWERPFYMRFSHESMLSRSLEIKSLASFYRDSHEEQIKFGLFFGLIIALALYNLFLFFSLRDPSYLYYVLYISSVSLFMGVYRGLTFEYLWPDSPLWHLNSYYFFLGLAYLGGTLFTRSFLNTGTIAPLWDRILAGLTAAAGIDIVVCFFSITLADRLSYVIGICLLPAFLTAGILSWRRGFQPAKYYVIAWFGLLASIFFYAIHGIFEYTPRGIKAMDFVQVGIACEAILLSLGLADRINQLRREKERQEAARQEAQKANHAKSTFLASMSHELRTPMNSIINFSSLILEGIYGDIPDDLRDAVEEIDTNSDALLALINDVLDISKIEAGSMELQLAECLPESCIDTAATFLEHQASGKGLQLIREVDADLPILWADERRLTQHVLINLLKNAIKFTRAGEVRVGVRRQEDQVLFWVADTGIGIPPEEREWIFETFHQVDDTLTRKTEGTGLGLAIARSFVELHGGRIWVESQEGRGSTFFFTIPLRRELSV
jgi:two-component system, sensor histidine kinase LadS